MMILARIFPVAIWAKFITYKEIVSKLTGTSHFIGDAPPPYGGNFVPSTGHGLTSGGKHGFKVDIDVLKRFGERLEGVPRPNKTHLSTAVDIRWDRFVAYFDHLLRHGLIEPVDEDEEGVTVFRKTALGRELFGMVDRLHDLLTQRKPITLSSILAVTISAVWIAIIHL